MSNHQIRAEVARAELDELGAKHFLDVRATVRRMLEDLRGPLRAAFATSIAHRVLSYHREQPDEEAFAESGRPLLAAIWDGLGGERKADDEISTAVGRFYQGEYWRRRRHDDPADLDDHLVMTVFCAAECYMHGCLDFASWAGWRGFDVAAISAAADRTWPHRRPAGMSPYSWELAHPAVQSELERQLEDVELLSGDNERDGVRPVDARILARLREADEP